MAGTADSVADSSTATVVAPESVPEELVVPEEIKDEKGKARVQGFIDNLKTAREKLARYEAQGSIEEIAGLKTQLQTYESRLNTQIERLEQAREPGEAKSVEQKQLETLRTKAKGELREIDDGIAKGERAAGILDGMLEGLEEEAFDAQVSLMKEAGMSTKPEDVEALGTIIAAKIKADIKLKRLYMRDPEAAVKKGFKAVQDLFTPATTRTVSAQIQTDKEKLTHLGKPHGGGGGSGETKTPTAPQTALEGVKRSLAILRGQ